MDKLLAYFSNPDVILADIHQWLDEHVLNTGGFLQLLAVVLAFAVAFGLAPMLRRRYLTRISARGETLDSSTRNLFLHKLILPGVWLVILWGLLLCLQAGGWSYDLVKIVVSLLTAWVIIRIGSSFIHDKTLAHTLAVVAWTLAALSILNLLAPAADLLDRISFPAGEMEVSLLSILLGIFYFVILLWLANLIANVVEGQLQTYAPLTPAIRVLVVKLLRILLVVAVFMIVIGSIGVDLTLFAVFGGALGVGIGFGLQKVVSNFVSGIILLLDKSIKPGDVIALGDSYGVVKSLNARYVSLETLDGIEHLIPNEELITTRVENWSYSYNRVRLHIPVGIHYKADVRLAMRLCLEAANETDRVLKSEDMLPICNLSGFGDSSVDLDILVWIDDPQHGTGNVQSQILLRVWDKFHEHGIEIPYPQRDLHLRSSDVNFAGSSSAGGDEH